MRVTVSLPEDLVDSLDREAREQGSNRSAVLARLLREWRARMLTERIDRHLRAHPITREESELEQNLSEVAGELLD